MIDTMIKDGVRVDMTQAEVDDRDAQEALDTAPPTAAEMEADVQETAVRLLDGSDMDKALALTILDVAKMINPAFTKSDLKDRVVAHLRAIKGI